MEKNSYPPFILPLASFIGGIFWQQDYSCNLTIILATSILLLCLLILLFLNKVELNKLQLSSCFLFFFSGSLLLQTQKNKNLLLLNQFANKKLNIIAQVINKEKQEGERIREITKLNVKKICQEDLHSHQKTNFNLLFYTQTPTQAQVGDKIMLRNISFSCPNQNKNLSGNMTFENYLLKENVLATIFTKKLWYKKISRPFFSFKRWIYNKRDQLFKKLKLKFSSQTFCYFSSIFLGNKKNRNINNLKIMFGCWGISHHLARSGLHIILFILIWVFLLNLLPMNLYLKKIILLLICLIYQQLSWTSISFLRAFYLFGLFQVGQFFDQQTNFLHLLTFICFIILLFNPIQVLFLDFQLSFALTFALAWMARVTSRKTK